MRRLLVCMLFLFVIAAISAPVSAAKKATFKYCGYTITIIPDDPHNAGKSGTLVMETSSDYANVYLSGTYEVTDTRPPNLVINLTGTITAADATYSVEKRFVFKQKSQRLAWRRIIAWVETIIAS